ncbi:MAG: hypothetical protein RDV41_05415 [Planctomycetota bacterium]|nr:hypothetical protein [Planctomycetota bacterium]
MSGNILIGNAMDDVKIFCIVGNMVARGLRLEGVAKDEARMSPAVENAALSCLGGNLAAGV